MAEKESELIRKTCTGDMLAYQELIQLYSSRVHAIAYQTVGNSIDAQDIAQEVFIRLYKKLNTYKSQFMFSTWLYRLTVNLSIDFLRKKNRYQNVSLQYLPDESGMQDNRPLPPVPFEQKELKGAIQRIAGGLTMSQRKVFVLRELQGFSSDEIAEILKCKKSTVRVHLSKAREKIKNALNKTYFGNGNRKSQPGGEK